MGTSLVTATSNHYAGLEVVADADDGPREVVRAELSQCHLLRRAHDRRVSKLAGQRVTLWQFRHPVPRSGSGRRSS